MPSAGTTGEILLIDHVTGRGHALCELFLRGSTRLVHYGPAHPGLFDERIRSVPGVSLDDPGTAVAFCERVDVDFVFVSWIDSLAAGYVDELRAAGLRVVGPDRRAAQLEASKAAGKAFCVAHQLPVARWTTVDDAQKALDVVGRHPCPVVVKQDGLTAVSDGVEICHTPGAAAAAVRRTAARTGSDFRVVVEEYLAGRDVSVTAFVSGSQYLLLPPAMDYKRTDDDDRGTNCDGMGTVAPHPDDGPGLTAQMHRIVGAIVAGMATEGFHYSGFLYVGCMLVEDRLVVLEINTRLGDSEAQALLPGVQIDFHELCRSVVAPAHARPWPSGSQIRHDGMIRCCVAATQGYVPGTDPKCYPGWPHGNYRRGQEVRGLDDIDPAHAQVFFGGAARLPSGAVVSTSGRVLFVVAAGENHDEASNRAYAELAKVRFPGMRYRSDIGRGL
jgi:phosphoribosylamine--glycine ligase